jgi:endonuclease/exonuclease/phosphatase family metal-dependent hydrolase
MFSFYIFEQALNYNSTFPKHCPIIIMGDFNVDIPKYNNHGENKQNLLDFMD